MGEKEYAALHDALASSRIEGYQITPQTERDCENLMSGVVSVEELVKEILRRPAKAV